MFKYHDTPALDPKVAQLIYDQVMGKDVLVEDEFREFPWYLSDTSSTHEWWHEKMVEGFPDLRTHGINYTALYDNNMGFDLSFDVVGTKRFYSDTLEKQNLRVDGLFVAVQKEGDHTAWHTDNKYMKSIVIFLCDREEGDGGEFEYINTWAIDDSQYPPERDSYESIKITPKFNHWVEFDNPDDKGCWHRVTPNLSGEPRISLTIFFKPL